MGEPIQCMDWLKQMVMDKDEYEKLSSEEKTKKFPIGIFVNVDRPDYCELYEHVREAAQKNGRVSI